jgi:eukaryotic-like serine/threonine-protein kinase
MQAARTERFTLVRDLGEGAFGSVYEAWDEERRTTVAVKKLRHLDPAALYRFKQEFRALAGLSHPNLVRLHELISTDGDFFLTMDLVDGTSFTSYVRRPSRTVTDSDDRPIDRRAGVDFDRLRDALPQLVAGVDALHEAGKLHRDLKPSNVLVTKAGQVVILDFGMVGDLAAEGALRSMDFSMAGTPTYMAPEQPAGGAVTKATDWYAVGVILFEALTGNVPFDGDEAADVFHAKVNQDPPDPRTLVEGVPDDLAELCLALLRRDPAARPSGHEILRAVGERTDKEAPSRQGEATWLLGREPHFTALDAAFTTVREGRAVLCHLHGSSGMGKTALLRRYLDGLPGDAVVLEGRCYERESVPYKAVDSLVDALARYLTRLSRTKADALLPRDTPTLARLFPVLGRVESVAEYPRKGAESPDPLERRRRAFAALRELFGRLADRKPLVLVVDDFQWGDVDSAALLADLLRPPDPPTLLLLASYRSEDRDVEHVRMLRDLRLGIEVREVEVGPLLPHQAEVLALSLLGERTEAVRAQARIIAAESSGSPFFVQELVHHTKRGARRNAAGQVTLAEVLLDRVANLDVPARALLRVVAVMGSPLPLAVAAQAAGLGPQRHAALSDLQGGHFVRTRGARDDDEVETFHDRIRETLLASLDAGELAEQHKRLALALESWGKADAEVLARHFEAAGLRGRAFDHALIAADRAERALAFDRAAALHRFAIALADRRDTREILVRLGRETPWRTPVAARRRRRRTSPRRRGRRWPRRSICRVAPPISCCEVDGSMRGWPSSVGCSPRWASSSPLPLAAPSSRSCCGARRCACAGCRSWNAIRARRRRGISCESICAGRRESASGSWTTSGAPISRPDRSFWPCPRASPIAWPAPCRRRPASPPPGEERRVRAPPSFSIARRSWQRRWGTRTRSAGCRSPTEWPPSSRADSASPSSAATRRT